MSTQASTQDPRDLVAIHVWQADINKHGVGLDALDEFNPCFSTTRGLDILTKQLQRNDQGFSAIVMVLDERDALPLERLGFGLDGLR